MIKIKIEEMLSRKNKTKYWLVKKTESNYTAINKMIDGVSIQINLETLEKICKALDCKPGDLLEIVDE